VCRASSRRAGRLTPAEWRVGSDTEIPTLTRGASQSGPADAGRSLADRCMRHILCSHPPRARREATYAAACAGVIDAIHTNA
jgi:hypothetical protein